MPPTALPDHRARVSLPKPPDHHSPGNPLSRLGLLEILGWLYLFCSLKGTTETAIRKQNKQKNTLKKKKKEKERNKTHHRRLERLSRDLKP